MLAVERKTRNAGRADIYRVARHRWHGCSCFWVDRSSQSRIESDLQHLNALHRRIDLSYKLDLVHLDHGL